MENGLDYEGMYIYGSWEFRKFDSIDVEKIEFVINTCRVYRDCAFVCFRKALSTIFPDSRALNTQAIEWLNHYRSNNFVF